MVTQNQVTCRLPEYFNDPDSFIPERWLRLNMNKTNTEVSVHPYLVLPFGHGPRSCIARRLAEQNIQMVFLRVKKKKLKITILQKNIYLKIRMFSVQRKLKNFDCLRSSFGDGPKIFG